MPWLREGHSDFRYQSFTYETTTNESGNYSVTHLIPDTYKVHVEAPGFKAYDVPSVSVRDTSASIDAAMQVGAVTQTVEVTATFLQLQTDRADVDVQFSQKYVEDLPILNRNFTNFELLSPGTQKMPGFSHAATENPQGGGQIVVNGQHSRARTSSSTARITRIPSSASSS